MLILIRGNDFDNVNDLRNFISEVIMGADKYEKTGSGIALREVGGQYQGDVSLELSEEEGEKDQEEDTEHRI